MKKKEKIKTGDLQTAKNGGMRGLLLIVMIIITGALIVWVYSLGQKAEDTISVCIWATGIYKNQTIGEDSLVEYKMLKGEFEKYAVKNEDGTKSRRVVLWDERDKLFNAFAAYPLQANTIAFISDVVTSRTDNSDTVLYSYPGKELIALDLASEDLRTFKTFMKPGDRVNITALYKIEDTVKTNLEDGETKDEKVTLSKQETAFKDIMIADLLNSNGESVLDMYAMYNELPVYKQARLDADEQWKQSTQPTTLLVALTPEETESYYDYVARDGISFRMSLPQRGE